MDGAGDPLIITKYMPATVNSKPISVIMVIALLTVLIEL